MSLFIITILSEDLGYKIKIDLHSIIAYRDPWPFKYP